MTSRLITAALVSLATACAVDAPTDSELLLTQGTGKADGGTAVTTVLTKAHPTARLQLACNDPIATCLAEVSIHPTLQAKALETLKSTEDHYVATIEVVRESDGASAVFEQYYNFTPGRWHYQQTRYYKDIAEVDNALEMSSWHGDEQFFVTMTRERWDARFENEVDLYIAAFWE